MAKFGLISVALCVAVAIYAPCATSEQQDGLYDAANWNYWYDSIFGQNRELRMTEQRAMLALNRLHKGSSEPIDEIKKAMVDFFYDANVDKSEHCSAEYLDKYKSRCKEFFENAHDTMTSFCIWTLERVSESCSKRFITWTDSILISQDDRVNLLDLAADALVAYKQSTTGGKMARLVGLEATESFDSFKAAWQSGPCAKVLESRDEFRNANNELYGFLNAIETKPAKAKMWLDVIHSCELYESEDALHSIYKYVRM